MRISLRTVTMPCRGLEREGCTDCTSLSPAGCRRAGSAEARRFRRRALALMPSPVGGLVPARAVEDETLSAAVLAAVPEELADGALGRGGE
ncbi:hypothetical protein AZSP09_14820 [Azospira sp. I09]|nr:hypothetical protein AZSP09_14820 [Azospira sp. I09]